MPLSQAAVNDLIKETYEPGGPEPMSPGYEASIRNHLARFPNDTNFVTELAEAGKDKGGPGFGIVVCMEEYCWTEIALTADPAKPDGGRSIGWGSMLAFQSHCGTSAHVRGKTERCKKLKIPIEKPSPSSASQPSLATPAPARTLPSTTKSTGKQVRASILDAMSSPPSNRTPSAPSGATVARATPTPGGKVSRAIPSRLSSSSSHGSKAVQSSSSNASSREPLALVNKNTNGKGKQPVRQASSPSGPVPSSGLLGEDETEEDMSTIEEQNRRFDEIFAAKREPVASESASSPSITRPSSASAGITRPTSASAGPSNAGAAGVLPAPAVDLASADYMQVYSLIHQDVTANRSGLGIEHVPHGDKEQKYAAEAQHLVKSLSSYLQNKDKLRLILTRIKFLRERLVSPETVNPYIGPSIDMVITFQGLPTVIAKGATYLHDLASGAATGRVMQISCGCNGPSHYIPLCVKSKAAIAPPILASAVDNFHMSQMSQAPYPNAHAGSSGGAGNSGQIADTMGLMSQPGYGGGHGFMGLDDSDDDSDDEMSFFHRDIVAPQDLATFFAESFGNFASDSTVDDDLRVLGLSSLKDSIPGLRIQLMPHQVMGVSFMTRQEKNLAFKGGINGDAMGLGKTVQSIATIVANPSQDPKQKTTLIVAPLALLGQWKAEIESKTTHGLLKVYIHHGPKRTASIAALKQYDVVLTTYGMLVSEGPSEKKMIEEDGKKYVDNKKIGPLIKTNWYRIILDEAHQIRNRKTQAAKVIYTLKAHLRWCLTGTLVVNSLDDIFSHLHYLNISPMSQWEAFGEQISRTQKRSPKLATKRIQTILKGCMIRRHKDTLLNGKRLLELPTKTTTVCHLNFSDEERQIYTAVENRFKVTFNSFLRKGTVLKNYHVVLVMLTRLRQLTCHPWLLRRNPNDIMRDGDVAITDEDLFGGVEAPKSDDISEQARASTLVGLEFVERVKGIILERIKRLETASDNDNGEAGDCECSICYEQFTDERITPCCHSFCAECIDNIFNSAQGNADLDDADVQAGRRKCPLCRTVMDKHKIFRASAFEPKEPTEDEEDNWGEQAEEDDVEDYGAKISALADEAGMSDKKKGKRKAVEQVRTRNKKKRSASVKDVTDDVDKKPDGLDIEDVLPSIKMHKLGELVDAIIAQDPNQKVIVFSQFVEYIQLVSVFLRKRDVSHVKYVGSMNQSDREDTIANFNRPMEEEGSPRVILMSLKCGGVGLNLCAANHVICLDLAWNAATENQAVDRAHRIGQNREVTVHRLIINNSIDQRLMTLQNTKQALSDGAMGEGSAAKVGRLSVNDLIKLFGVNGGGHDAE
ncbi:hypothetical protein B9479_004597 [Cryptococcus floricola]|uniref:DNA repair protein RAD5 n=1 Tax=Cryptococcus floricola TaxID=2591691 RepID=A0A5D3AWV7_9TREE|nr:hypothetical protein B9479_004597 [Cryptococcus floricola]